MFRMLSLAFLIVIFTPALALAAGQDPVVAATQRVLNRVFSEAERAMIEEYFNVNTGSGEQCPRKEKCKHKHGEGHDGDDDGDGKDKGRHGHGRHGHGSGSGRHEQCRHEGRDGDHGALPPGLERQLKRNGHLPPGLEGRALPPGLAKNLPATAKGTKRVIIGDDVVLVDSSTQIILDVIKGVLGQTRTGRQGFNN